MCPCREFHDSDVYVSAAIPWPCGDIYSNTWNKDTVGVT